MIPYLTWCQKDRDEDRTLHFYKVVVDFSHTMYGIVPFSPAVLAEPPSLSEEDSSDSNDDNDDDDDGEDSEDGDDDDDDDGEN
jgi:hypothetical protein